MRIKVTDTHLASGEAAREVAQVIAGTIETDNGELSNAAAVTIAALYQSPGPVGSVLASFASGREVDDHELLEDIAAVARTSSPVWPTMLECLSTWVINFDGTV